MHHCTQCHYYILMTTSDMKGSFYSYLYRENVLSVESPLG